MLPIFNYSIAYDCNNRYMDHLGYDFVIMVKGMKSFVNDKIREVQGSFEEKRQYTIRRYQVNGTTVKTKVFYSDEKDRYLHISNSRGLLWRTQKRNTKQRKKRRL